MTAVFSYTEKSSEKLDRDSIRTHRESKKKLASGALGNVCFANDV